MRRSIIVLLLGAVALAMPAGSRGEDVVQNGNFDHDLAGWTERNGALLSFDPARDADGFTDSGSAVLANPTFWTLGWASLVHCFDDPQPGIRYVAGARVRFREGETRTGNARLAVEGMSGDGCTGLTTTFSPGAEASAQVRGGPGGDAARGCESVSGVP